MFYLYTQGTVTRYSTNKNDDGKREKWMGITAEYASGSSDAPVLNKYGSGGRYVGTHAEYRRERRPEERPQNDPKPMRATVPTRRRADPPKNEKKDEKKKDVAKPDAEPEGLAATDGGEDGRAGPGVAQVGWEVMTKTATDERLVKAEAMCSQTLLCSEPFRSVFSVFIRGSFLLLLQPI